MGLSEVLCRLATSSAMDVLGPKGRILAHIRLYLSGVQSKRTLRHVKKHWNNRTFPLSGRLWFALDGSSQNTVCETGLNYLDDDDLSYDNDTVVIITTILNSQ